MNRLTIAGFFITLGVVATFAGCTAKDTGAESATVNPGTPAVTGGAQPPTAPGAAAPGPTGIQTTYSGLKYEVLRPGTGARPASYNRVKVHYHGYLPDGTVFDSSVQRGEPATFGLNQVIPGWREGIPLMQVGAKYRFTVPPHLAYGARGAPPKIGPNQTLMFDVELFEILY